GAGGRRRRAGLLGLARPQVVTVILQVSGDGLLADAERVRVGRVARRDVTDGGLVRLFLRRADADLGGLVDRSVIQVTGDEGGDQHVGVLAVGGRAAAGAGRHAQG